MRQKIFLHKFKVDGRKYILSVGDSRIWKVDDLTFEIADLYNSLPREKIIKRLSKKYFKGSILKSLKSFSKMAKVSPPVDPSLWKVPFKHIKNKSIVRLDLVPTYNCNLRCDYCYLTDRIDYKFKKEMSQDIAQKALNFLFSQSNEKDILIGFRGREPLLNFGVIKFVIERCEEYAKKTGRRFAYSLTTNGTLLSEEIYNFFAGHGHKVHLGISLDGNKKTHDSVRRFPDGKGSHDLIIKKINKIREWDKDYFDKKVSFLPVITPQNPSLLERLKYFKNLGIDDITFPMVNPTNKYKLNSQKRKLLSHHQQMYDSYIINKFISKNFEEMNYKTPYPLTIRQLLKPTRHSFPCRMGITYIVVDVDGGIYPCDFFVGNKNFLIGNIERGLDFRKIFMLYKDFNEITTECSKCWAIYFCSRPCFYKLAKKNGGFRKPTKKYCKIFKKDLLSGLRFFVRTKKDDPEIFNDWTKFIAKYA